MTFAKHAGVFTLAALLSTSVAIVSANAQSTAPYYEGKTVEIYVGFSPGGGYDTYARILAEHLPRHIPGNPVMVVKNMPGGGSRTAAGYMANIAPDDGTAIATTDQSLPLFQVLGDDTITYDMAAFNYIGNPIADNNLVVTWHTSPVKTFEDAQTIPSIMGASGLSSSSYYPAAMNAMLGTQFEIILGYQGGNDINLAMQQGEVDGRGSNSWSSYKATTPFVANNELNYIAQVGLERAPDLPDVPLLIDLAQNEEDEGALRLLSAPTAIGRPFYTTDGTPAEVVEILRAAFDATIADPEFVSAIEVAGLELNPIGGAELQAIVEGIVNTPAEAVAKLEEALDQLVSQ